MVLNFAFYWWFKWQHGAEGVKRNLLQTATVINTIKLDLYGRLILQRSRRGKYYRCLELVCSEHFYSTPPPHPPPSHLPPKSPPHKNKGKNNVARLTSHAQTRDTATSESPWTYILLTCRKQHDTCGCSKPLLQPHADHIPVHDSTLWKTKSRSRVRQWTDYNSTQDTQQACDEQISSTGAEILAERANAAGHIYI